MTLGPFLLPGPSEFSPQRSPPGPLLARRRQPLRTSHAELPVHAIDPPSPPAADATRRAGGSPAQPSPVRPAGVPVLPPDSPPPPSGPPGGLKMAKEGIICKGDTRTNTCRRCRHQLKLIRPHPLPLEPVPNGSQRPRRATNRTARTECCCESRSALAFSIHFLTFGNFWYFPRN
jgi:hypothetical protein